MRHPNTSPADILRMLENDGFANLVDGQVVHISRQEQLNRALELACECGHLELVKQLHQTGAEIKGNPEPLCVAAEHDQRSIVEYLVDSGADINAHSRQLGQTALMDAAGSASLAVFEYLLEQGAETTATCDDGETALDWARMGRHTAALPEIAASEDVLRDYDNIIAALSQYS